MLHFLTGFLSATTLATAFFGTAALFAQHVLFRAPPLRYQAGGYSFIVPEGWNCTTKGTETVCHPQAGPLARQAIIVATAKVTGPNDNYEFYKSYLSKPISRRSAPTERSEVLTFAEVTVNGNIWLDSSHRNSLMGNYVSRYMVAKQSALSVLVTYSVHNNQYEANKALGDALLQGVEVRALR